ncbi:MAG: hydrogenase maturation nickel metallochaperone HypA [Endomicrobia bacterium]|nr:hydrogenase maturation nickel metallochaperone HypA [Endomicrobiia bacterium]MCL2798927.1 hydrogenase maturation nickel metallochaperone HypA [Endomicrobiia bacterium]
MHEHGIAKELWKIVLAEAQKNNISKITKLTIALGEASGIEKDFLNHSFVDHIFMENEIAKGAVIEYEFMPLAAKCNICSFDVKPSDMSELVCPNCKSGDISVISGRETYVKSIEGE